MRPTLIALNALNNSSRVLKTLKSGLIATRYGLAISPVSISIMGGGVQNFSAISFVESLELTPQYRSINEGDEVGANLGASYIY